MFATHYQNLPQQLGSAVSGPVYNRTREDGSSPQNVVWVMPWISTDKVPFPGLAYCLGGRSLFWGGWSPRLTAADLGNWPNNVVTFLTQPAGTPPASEYDRTEREIGAVPTADFMFNNTFHADLSLAFKNAAATQPRLASVDEAPLAVLGSAPDSGLFPFDKFSSAPFLFDAVRDDVAVDFSELDVSRRIFVVPRTQVLRLHPTGSAVTSLDMITDGTAVTLNIPPRCAVVLANGTIEATRIALDSLGVGDTTFGTPRVGNLLAHLRSNITVRITRTALGLPATPPPNLETTAFLVRGTGTSGRQFHFQVTAAAVGGTKPEKNVFQQVPDIDTLDQIRANQDPTWIAIVLRCVGEMEDSRTLPHFPDPGRSWIDLSSETDGNTRRAFVNLAPTGNDKTLWDEMDNAAFDLAAALAGNPNNIEYLQSDGKTFHPNRPQPNPQGPGTSFWNDGVGTTHHEAGTLYMGAPGNSVTDTTGRFHGIDNAYVAGPALFPTLGSANPSLTALSLARRTAHAIVTDRTLTPPAGSRPCRSTRTTGPWSPSPAPTPPSNLSVRCWRPPVATACTTTPNSSSATPRSGWNGESCTPATTPASTSAPPARAVPTRSPKPTRSATKSRSTTWAPATPPARESTAPGPSTACRPPPRSRPARPANGTATSSKRPARRSRSPSTGC